MVAKLLSTPIGKKLGMALTGLLLYGFLIGHLAGNLLLLKGDGGQAFNAYSDFLTSHPLLIPVELVLLAIFVLHIYLAIRVTHDNRRARPRNYQAGTQAVGGRPLASATRFAKPPVRSGRVPFCLASATRNRWVRLGRILSLGQSAWAKL